MAEQQRTNARQSGEETRQSSGERSLQSSSSPSLRRRYTYPSLFAGSPFELMRRLSDDMFRSVLGGSSFAGEEHGLWSPRVEAFQEGDEFIVRAELPGLSADDVSVDVSDDAIAISGERRQEHRERRGGAFVSEISYGSFNRVIPLPDAAISDSAKATFRDGVLEIKMPAPPSEVRRGRRIEINAESGQGRSGQNQTDAQGQTSTGGQSQSGGSKGQTTESR
jgi:HSP20 family protein